MKILALECSAGPASVALAQDGKIIGSNFINVKLTHSQTLMPMVEGLLSSSKTAFDEIEGIAISWGPGSFTGIRIGISAVKGLAFARKLPCVGVSTLEAIAQNFIGRSCYVCAVMDARCNQVYNALFKIDGNQITRLCPDSALLCEELKTEIESLSQEGMPIVVCGDGTDLFMKYVAGLPCVSAAAENYKFQNATGVALAATEHFQKGNTLSAEELLPFYLRLPQAERELKTKQNLEV